MSGSETLEVPAQMCGVKESYGTIGVFEAGVAHTKRCRGYGVGVGLQCYIVFKTMSP